MASCKVEIYSEEGIKVTTISADRFVIGRSTKADLIIEEEGISRNHLTVFIKNDALFLVDEGSANGTFVEKNRLTPKIEFPYNQTDLIRLGTSKKQIKIAIVQNIAKLSGDKSLKIISAQTTDEKISSIDVARQKKEAELEFTRLRSEVEDELAHKRITAYEKLEAEIKQKRDLAMEDIKTMKLALDGEIKTKNELLSKLSSDVVINQAKFAESNLALDSIFKLKDKEQKEFDEIQKTARTLKEEILNGEQRVQEIKREIDKLAREKRVEVEARESEIKIAKMNLEVELQEIQSKKIIAERELKLMEMDKKNVDDLIVQQNELKQRLQLNIEEIKDNLELKKVENQKEMNVLLLSKKELEEELELIKKEIGSCRLESGGLEDKKMAIENEIATLISKKKSIEEEMVDKNILLTKEKEQIESEITKAQSELQATMAELKLQKVTHKIEIEKATSVKKILEKEIEDLKNVKANLLVK